MKLLSKLALLFTLFIALNACSNDFLDDVHLESDLAFGLSAIYISPEWEEDDYWFSCPIARSADFSIEEAPDWLIIENMTGSLTYSSSPWVEPTPQSKGTIRARATVNPDYAKVGIYIDYMVVKANNKSYRVPVYYISEGDPKLVVNNTLQYSYTSYGSLQLPISNNGDGILLWDIVSMPDWLSLDSSLISPNGVILARNTSYYIPLKIKLDANVSVDEYEGDIVLRSNDKQKELATVRVTIDLGNPVCYISGLYNNRVDFNSNLSNISFTIYNQGNGLLNWQFADLPDWLKVSKSSGILGSYYSESIQFSVESARLETGLNVDTIRLLTNDPGKPSLSILVTARGEGNNELTFPIEGNVVDAMFLKSSNTLVYATTQPNKLLFYDAGTKTVTHEIALSKAPSCFTVSEDLKLAAVGHSGLISTIDLSNYSVSKQILLNNSVYDIAWADSSLFCYTEQADNSDYIYWVDVLSGAKSSLKNNNVDGKTRLKKVPTKPYFIASRQQTSPSGIITFSIATQSIKSYAHKTISDYWFTEDGEYMITRNGEVYRTSSAFDATDTFSANINPIDRLTDGSSTTYYYPLWVDHSVATNKLFIINNNYSSQSLIHQFDDVDYFAENSYVFDKMYRPNEQTATFEVSVHYVFANREGTELLVLRKGKDNNYWSLEYIVR